MHHELPAAANSKLEHLEGVREAVWSPPAREQFGVGEGLENAVADGSAPDGTERRCRSLFFGFVTYPSITLWIAILLTAAAATPNDLGSAAGAASTSWRVAGVGCAAQPRARPQPIFQAPRAATVGCKPFAGGTLQWALTARASPGSSGPDPLRAGPRIAPAWSGVQTLRDERGRG